MSSPPDASDVGARVRRRLAVLGAARDGEGDVGARRRAYREAAALLTAFDPATLRPAGDDARPGGALLELIDDCVTVGAAARRLWTLKREVRTATLQRMSGRAQALRALEANGDPDGRPVEAALQAYLRGTAPPLESQGLEQLSRSLQALRLLGEIDGLDGVPSVDDALRVYARKQLFDPLESLIRDGFHGRNAELSELRLHVGVLELTTVSTRLRGAAKRVNPFGSGLESPLMVHGPPGIGKSTLLAKFVLDHALAGDRRIPFVYVDFERPTLSALEPATLLAEAARQLVIQYPDAAPRFDAVAGEAAREARRRREATLELAELDDVSAARVTVHRDAVQHARADARLREDELIRRLAAIVRELFAGAAAPPLLIVLDSFEQAQYRSSPHLRRLWDMFDAFQRAYPSVRVVVSGRAPVDELALNRRPAKELRLEELDRPAAIAFLAGEGVRDERLAELLAQRFGGNPLSLKLAARMARRAELGTDWVADVPTRRWVLFRVEDSQIQSRLYQRLLASIADPDVAALAHPGLILRRITPAIIEHVLAGPCAVDVPDGARARQLFEAVARQVDLVQRDGDVLVHRPDVRRDMLPLVERDKPQTVEQLERAAVAYYAGQDGVEARAEEIYHRLRLGEAPRAVDRRWEPGVERHLWGAESEVPARAQAYLAAKVAGARATPAALGEADDEDWEALVAREADDLLDQGADDAGRRRAAKAALALMGARRAWSAGSPLYRLKAEALEMLGDREAAAQVVQDGIAAIDDERVPATAAVSSARLDLLLLAARHARSRGSAHDADRLLEEAERLAGRLGRDADVLATLLLRMRLQRDGDDALRTRAAQRFAETGDDELRAHAALARAIAVELGPAEPAVLARAIGVLGLEPRDAAQLDELARGIVELASADAELRTWLEGYAARRGVRFGDPAASVRALVEHVERTGRLAELAQALVATGDRGAALRASLAAMLPQPAAASAAIREGR